MTRSQSQRAQDHVAQIVDFSTTDTDSGALVAAMVENAVAVSAPHEFGQHGRAFVVPKGYSVQIEDTRELDDPKPPHHIARQVSLTTSSSLADYVNRYKTADTTGYVHDATQLGPRALTNDLVFAEYVIDEHPAGASTAFREHVAKLVLRPTPAARRWGAALSAGAIDQEHLLDLVVDGIREIATPDAATLRDLVADLHAIRTTSARSVARTGGATTVEVAENVTLHGGTGNMVEIPGTIVIVLQPFTGIHMSITLELTVKPRVGQNEKVTFALAAPQIDDEITKVLDAVAAALASQIELATPPLWIP